MRKGFLSGYLLALFFLFLPAVTQAIQSGHEVEKGQFAFVGRMAFYDDNIETSCSIVLIAPDKVLTSAHCLVSSVTGDISRAIRDGAYIWISFPNSFGYSSFLDYHATRLILHPAYLRETYLNGDMVRHFDVALLVLNRDVESVESIPIQDIVPEDRHIRSGVQLGFGGSGSEPVLRSFIFDYTASDCAQNSICNADRTLRFTEPGDSGGATISLETPHALLGIHSAIEYKTSPLVMKPVINGTADIVDLEKYQRPFLWKQVDSGVLPDDSYRFSDDTVPCRQLDAQGEKVSGIVDNGYCRNFKTAQLSDCYEILSDSGSNVILMDVDALNLGVFFDSYRINMRERLIPGNEGFCLVKGHTVQYGSFYKDDKHDGQGYRYYCHTTDGGIHRYFSILSTRDRYVEFDIVK
ncbi:MAG: trypsin-like serine protease [Endozoicomonas sp.]|uniref:trypsin-like serine protease n=1 Tax=Endozoicomonas sp. TaxID=1892382 RepID=UPI003D9BC203